MNHADAHPEVSLEDRVLSALECHPRLSKRNLRFEAEEGQVTLKGSVRSFFEKQIAQETLRRIDGVRQIHNEIEVSWPPAALAAE